MSVDTIFICVISFIPFLILVGDRLLLKLPFGDSAHDLGPFATFLGLAFPVLFAKLVLHLF